MRVYTIGFTKKPASDFFGMLRDSGARRLVDVRLNNVSQLAGFAKRDDLEYFLHEICRMEYVHLPELAPTKEMLAAYRNEHRDWDTYERQFIGLMDERANRGQRGEEYHRRLLPAVQRGQAGAMPSPSRRRVSRPPLG